MNLAKDALHVLGSVAPTLATAVAGPFGGMAVTAIENALGLTSASSSSSADQQKAIESALGATDPTTLLALKKAEEAFTEQMTKLGITKDKLTYDDLASARTMEAQTKDPTARRLAWLIVGGFLAFAAAECLIMTFWPTRWAAIPRDGAALIGMVFGYLANEAKQVASFYFGSSAESAGKDATLADIAKS